MKVEVVRSPRRRKTVQAREVNGVLRVSIPATMTAADEERWVAEMVRRTQRRAASRQVDLDRRAAELARRYHLSTPASIRWSDNQEWRWGSCTPAARTVRVSSRLAREPGWVLDYVIVHELAHLEAPRHDQRFWAVVNRYPLTERARGYLMARGVEPGDGTRCDRVGATEGDETDTGADTGPDALVAGPPLARPPLTPPATADPTVVAHDQSRSSLRRISPSRRGR